MFRTLLRRVRRTDAAIAAGFVVFALVEEYVVRMPGGWWPYVLALFAVLVLLRRVVPVLAMAVNSVAANATLYHETELQYRLWQLVAMIIAAFTVGQLVSGPGRGRLRVLTGGLFVALTALVYWDAERTDPLAAVFFTGAPYALGIAVAAQSRRLAETATVRASIRERQAREAVMEERVRIARELHDMVAHSVTVMVIQAGVVRRRLDAGLPVDPALLESIESSGRDAVGELRRTLGLLRGDGAETAQAPAGLDRLDELIAQVREAGLTVDVRRTGEAVALLPAVDLSAYRIVQEALTNVLKHAGPARVVVSLDYREDGLHLGVVNDGVAGVPAGAGGGGQGLIGMRERVALFGGELVAGPREEGGFSVRARLPVPARGVASAPSGVGSAGSGPGFSAAGSAGSAAGSSADGSAGSAAGSSADGSASSAAGSSADGSASSAAGSSADGSAAGASAVGGAGAPVLSASAVDSRTPPADAAEEAR